MAKFKNFIPPKSVVIREGKRDIIPACELVRGDIVLVKEGDSIPADIRVISSNEMKVDNSSLTGETEELLRDNKCTSDNIIESMNMAFFGTKCTSGSCKGVVVLTGQHTIIGLIANLAQNASVGDSTLKLEMNRFIKIIAILAVSVGVLFFVVGMILKPNWILNFIYMIGLIVANVPEGLVATVTVGLTLSAKMLSKKNVLVKNLESLETLGCTTCICTDKTGTLTQNKMKVTHAFLNIEKLDLSANYQEVETKGLHAGYNPKDPDFDFLVDNICLATKAAFIVQLTDADKRKAIAKKLNKAVEKLTEEEISTNISDIEKMLSEIEEKKPWLLRKVDGDASETGLIKFAQPIKDVINTREKFPSPSINGKICEIPFSSATKTYIIVRRIANQDGSFKHYRIYIKGAPDRLWELCTYIYVHKEKQLITPEIKEQIIEANNSFCKFGERVIGFSFYDLDANQYPENFEFDCKSDNKNFPSKGFTFLALVSLLDPLRDGVADAVQTCKQGGVKVIMVTGDQPPTALNIAQQCHIISDASKELFTIMERENISEDQAMEKAESVIIKGDMLAKRHLEDDQKSDSDPTKGLYLRKWLNIKEVVFARTNPAQKLQIVDGCQKLNHIVAVTGDGVNDSPAIKKANIGIAMGSGMDIARDAADMVLLTDDFSSILTGIVRGRVIFDNLRKAITYALISNIPELVPFLLLIIIQVPLPLTTVLMLCVDVGTDLLPAISFAYEPPESDLMKKGPRNHQLDHLVNGRVLSTAYFQLGMIEAMAGAYTYFAVMAEYGFKPMTLLFLNFKTGECTESNSAGRTFNWINQKDNATTFYNCSGSILSGSNFYTYNDVYHDISSETGKEIAYTSEALVYAQTACFVAIIVMQWGDYFCLRTRMESMLERRWTSWFQPFAIAFETCLLCLLVYTPGVNTAFGTRRIPFRQWLYPTPFLFSFILYEEVKKLIIRTMKCSYHKYNWFRRNIAI